ncbi:MAG: glycerophosphodiester phosphodiesterase family protein [Chloroflexota bacterium]
MQLPILIAHRGGSLEAPENTMAAFQHAIDLGMRYVELDVQMSSDGELMVIHDETLDRTTNGSGAVGDYTYDELRKLSAGAHFGPEYAEERIPTLREVLDLCVDAGVGVVIELKSPALYIGMEEKVAALLAEMWLRGAENLWCISFDHPAIRKMRTLDATIPLGYLYEYFEEKFVQPDDNIQAYCPYFRTAVAHPEQIAKAHELGKLVFVYTANEEADMLAVVAAGIDGMVSDRPSLLKELFNQ